ncbi:MAG TPA: exodeoxyribonuclease VII small subunit [Acholeplasmataceae bacterium]|jgi:exodeoxyribonuclease VII small subunit|nr:exodeoxyribonuclease VII small subunit [Acholeplasmataceae bacterium]HQC30986.1 exodeoxyribonuclease VII small subunit [Acholeplasmataceae bacterium]
MENKKSFEQLLKELEQIVRDLEAKDIQLEAAIKKYQEGIELAKLSYKMLEDANALIMKKVDEEDE